MSTRIAAVFAGGPTALPRGARRWAERGRAATAAAAVAAGVILCPPAGLGAGEEPAVVLDAGEPGADAGPVRVGERVPRFRARSLSGEQVSLEGLLRDGRPVVLAFWSKYCKACVEKFSALVALQAKYGSRGLQVISVNTDGEYREGPAAIRAYVAGLEAERKLAVNFPVVYDDDNRIPCALGIRFLPTIVGLDAHGRVLELYQRYDEASEAQILAGIEELVQRTVAASPHGGP